MGRPEPINSALLDASALLGVITGDPAFRCLHPLLDAVDRGEVTLVESTAILTEVLPRHRHDDTRRALARKTLSELLESPKTRLVDVSPAVARKAGDLRTAHSLKTWDAIHLATAILARVDVLVVRDNKFPAGDYEGVWVTGPFDLDDDKLFSGLGDARADSARTPPPSTGP
ncbi:type II toxin-antitoxin system VapC family toxin [Nocardioides litoris]|uniref:type II toxin-antitoxin system VapC family toxin n=1 Tax=Nocardioides litoris TaxID=1926648 RepID=UPI0011226648|nr:type II toxin-antitoxin system VapC family toxin [Nocardioides litoris]